MQQSPSQLTRRIFGTLPVGASLEVKPTAFRIVPAPKVETRTDGLLLETLRANLHAAARHAALGHTGPSFRDCPGPACREAAKLIPELDSLQGGATDTELEAILDEVLTRLEREGTPFFAPKPS